MFRKLKRDRNNKLFDEVTLTVQLFMHDRECMYFEQSAVRCFKIYSTENTY